ncbi:phage holin family protein, partial [Salmonella enterica subsp. enterica serovar Enteritidis]|nr:phage holin family protein [Salmonella enterica subsp. enterica serovar Enteritidis]MCL8894608.1 phage holin family protein [Salmonella enterica subsp. enterica serovar Enteritidis]
PKTSIICSPMTSLKTSIKTITYLSDIGCLEIQGASLVSISPFVGGIIGFVGVDKLREIAISALKKRAGVNDEN